MGLNQYVLPLVDHDRDALAAARIRAACKAVAADLGHKAIADLWGCHESSVGLKLEEKNRNYIRPSEMIALKRADRRGLIRIAEEAELDPPTTPEQVVERLPHVLRELFADELAELVERKLGLR
jgi:uncharacterized protein (DUF2267 family)